MELALARVVPTQRGLVVIDRARRSGALQLDSPAVEGLDGSESVLEVLTPRGVKVDVVKLKPESAEKVSSAQDSRKGDGAPVEPEETGEPRAVTRGDITNDLGEGGLLAGGDVEIADGEKATRRKEAVDAVDEGQHIGHHTVEVAIRVSSDLLSTQSPAHLRE